MRLSHKPHADGGLISKSVFLFFSATLQDELTDLLFLLFINRLPQLTVYAEILCLLMVSYVCRLLVHLRWTISFDYGSNDCKILFSWFRGYARLRTLSIFEKRLLYVMHKIEIFKGWSNANSEHWTSLNKCLVVAKNQTNNGKLRLQKNLLTKPISVFSRKK